MLHKKQASRPEQSSCRTLHGSGKLQARRSGNQGTPWFEIPDAGIESGILFFTDIWGITDDQIEASLSE